MARGNADRDVIKIGVLVVLLVVIAIVRCFFGVETTDEAMYVAESVSMAEGGIVPYATNWFHSSGYAVVAVPFIKLWKLVNGDLEGIFLFTRIMYTLVKIGFLSWGVAIVKRWYPWKIAILFLTPLILFAPGSTSNFSYNTIPFLLEILAACYMTKIVRQGMGGNDVIKVAVLVAVASFLNPTNIILAMWWLVALMILVWKKKVSKGCILKYVAAGIIAAFIVCLILSFLAGGFHVLLEGFISATKYNPYYHQKEVTVATQWQYIKFMLKGLLGCGCLCLICYFFFPIKGERDERKRHAILIGMIIFILAVCLWYCKSASYIMRVLAGGLVLAPPVLCKGEKKEDGILLWIWWLPGILNLIVSATTAYYGIADRAYLLLPGILMITLLYAGKRKEKGIDASFLFAAILSIGLACGLLGYTYRDANMWNCKERVGSGIYKGIFTTSENCEYLAKLEKYIKEVTLPTDAVFAQQSFPALYLMSNGRMLSPTSWSSLVFADVPYTGNDFICKYFEFMEREPDIILYHYNHFGPVVHIKDNLYPFCRFVNEKYEKMEEKEDLPGLEIYRRKDSG